MEKYSPGRSSFPEAPPAPAPARRIPSSTLPFAASSAISRLSRSWIKNPLLAPPSCEHAGSGCRAPPCAGLFSIAPAHPSRSPAGRLAAGAAALLTGFLPPRTLSYLLAGSMVQLLLPGSTAGALGFMHSPFKRAQFRPAAASVWPLPASSRHPDGWPDRQPCVRASGPFPHAGPGRSDRMGSW